MEPVMEALAGATAEASGSASAAGPEKADLRLAHLAAWVGPLRRVQAAIAAQLLETAGWEKLCFARPGDYSRERPGLSRRQLQDLARVHRALAALPGLEAALVGNELPWSKVRLLARVATAADEARWIEHARGLPCRQLEAEVRAAAAALTPSPGSDDEEPQRRIRVRCTPADREQWERLREVAERVAGQRLTAAEALELVLAEVVSELPVAAAEAEPSSQGQARRRASGSGPRPPPRARARPLPARIAALLEGLDEAGPRELDRRLRLAVHLEQTLDAAMAPLLRVVRCAEYEWSGAYQTLAHHAREQLGMAPSKARALVRLERAGDVCPELLGAYRGGRLSWMKAQCLLPLLLLDVEGEWRPAWVDWAARVTLRRLEADVRRALLLRAAHPEAWRRCLDDPSRAQDPVAEGERQMCARASNTACTEELTWRVPVSVAALFSGVYARLGGDFGALLARALAAWSLRDPAAPRPDPVIARDGYRCAVPGCSGRRNLHDHHIRFRSAGGTDAPENRVTLCAFHHQRCVHEGRMQIRGRAPDELIFELPLGRYLSGDVAIPWTAHGSLPAHL